MGQNKRRKTWDIREWREGITSFTVLFEETHYTHFCEGNHEKLREHLGVARSTTCQHNPTQIQFAISVRHIFLGLDYGSPVIPNDLVSRVCSTNSRIG